MRKKMTHAYLRKMWNYDLTMEEVISSRKQYRGRVINLRIDTVKINNRNVVREIVEHPGASAIVPLTDDSNVILVSQYRHAARTQLFEIPAGTLKPGEAPENCAIRELEEETGYSCAKLDYLTTIYPSPGYSDEVINIYLARVGRLVGQKTEPDEKIKVVRLGLDEAIKMIEERKIQDAKTIVGLLLTHKLLNGT